MDKDVSAVQGSKQVDELCEDMIVVGPGQMLSEARKKLSLSIEDIANKLNFKATVVADIEQDIFDQKLPATFNRGYLRSYAKLLNVDKDDVLSAYDMLGIAEVQRSEMQSFSNLTEKQAEHSRLMWLSYLIVAILFALMVLWWLQAPEAIVAEEAKPIVEQVVVSSEKLTENATGANRQVNQQVELAKADENNQAALPNTVLPQEQQQKPAAIVANTVATSANKSPLEAQVASQIVNQVGNQVGNNVQTVTASVAEEAPQALAVSTAVFTFSGDCWVNIYDATGERVAWGVKKSGYVMTVSGKAPLKVTLGKPELASIVFDDQQVELSTFNVGNIAKFTLPLQL